ncbi:MAG: hypothetical protein AAF363_02155 [Bacteroidota bacterium]
MNHQEQIPVWGYINFQLLYQIHLAQQSNTSDTTTISDLLENTNSHINSNIPLKTFNSPINSGAIFSFLYSLLVVPKELFNRENLDFFIGFDFELADYFEIISGIEKIQQREQIFRVLRNSMSHVNYHVDDIDKYSVVMWNESRTGQKNIIVKSNINKLGNFAVELAKYYIAKMKS